MSARPYQTLPHPFAARCPWAICCASTQDFGSEFLTRDGFGPSFLHATVLGLVQDPVLPGAAAGGAARGGAGGGMGRVGSL